MIICLSYHSSFGLSNKMKEINSDIYEAWKLIIQLHNGSVDVFGDDFEFSKKPLITYRNYLV
jgi:hypothetical protein